VCYIQASYWIWYSVEATFINNKNQVHATQAFQASQTCESINWAIMQCDHHTLYICWMDSTGNAWLVT